MAKKACTHLTAIHDVKEPQRRVCEECEKVGGRWVHLRTCQTCGTTRCCDSSPGQHASAHFRASGHRYMQSFEPGEDWFFDFETEEVLEGPELAAPTSHPVDQTAPGPQGRVPADWRDHVHR